MTMIQRRVTTEVKPVGRPSLASLLIRITTGAVASSPAGMQQAHYSTVFPRIPLYFTVFHCISLSKFQCFALHCIALLFGWYDIYVWVNSCSIISTRKNDRWKYILRYIFFNAEYIVMVHLTLWIQKFWKNQQGSFYNKCTTVHHSALQCNVV